MNVLAITLARGGSKGIPKKNLVKLAGKPLIQYTIDLVNKCELIDRYIVSTDDIEIRDYCLSQGVDVPFLRPSYLASDQATSADALIHAVKFCEQQEKLRYDYVIELMATNPFKNKNDVESCINKLKETNADSVIGVTRVEEHHPARLKKIESDKIFDFCVPELSSRRQDLRPYAYIRNGSIYALNRNKLIDNKHRFGGSNSRPHIMPSERGINIDGPIDLALCELLIEKRK
tara:strand:- start:323 stop:1018 length:696 start_codon:yes stop_codon:yes gene_type:complete